MPALVISVSAVITAAVGVFLFGTAWDTQWHLAVGRDRLFTMPHVIMLAGIAIAGLASLVALVAETWHVGFKHLPAVARDRIGLVLAGLGALFAAAAFPLDDYWHSLYGIDVTLWAPFHVMIGTAMGLAGVGATAQFAAIRTGRRFARDVASMIAIAVTSSTFMVFLAESAGRRALLQLGDATLVVYPVLLSVALPAAVVCAAVAVSRPGAALLAALVIQVARQSLFVLVPWATTTLVAIEGQVLRPNAPTWTTTPNAFPGLSLIVVALAAEVGVWWARRNSQPIHLPVFVAAVIATVPASFIDRPWEILVPKFYPPVDLGTVAWTAAPFVVPGALFGGLLGLCVGMAIAPAQRAWSGRSLSRVMRLAPAALLIVAFSGSGIAFAHDGAPEAATQSRVGPYVVDVRYYAEPVGGRELSFEIVPVSGTPAPSTYTVIAVPGPTTSATPVRAHLTPAVDHAGQTGVVNLPFGGKWLLDLEVDGPLGPGSADVPVIAALPAAVMPEWLAWLIGALPLSTLLALVAARLIGLGPKALTATL